MKTLKPISMKRFLINYGILLLVITSGVHLRMRNKNRSRGDNRKPGGRRQIRTLPPIKPEEYRQNLLKYVFSKVEGYKDGDSMYECKGESHPITTYNKNTDDRCCSCDKLCHKRNDCCYDVEYEIGSTVQPPQYNNIVAAKADQYVQYGCLPVVAHNHTTKNHTVEYVIGVHKCPDKSPCITPENNKTLQLVKGDTDNVFYVNEYCARCNGQNFTYPEIEISQCIDERYIRYLDSNQTDFDLQAQLYKGCHLKLADPSKNTCPFGGLTDPYTRDDIQCSSKLTARTCGIYFAAVQDSTGKVHANPSCMSCENVEKPSTVNCQALRKKYGLSSPEKHTRLQLLDIRLLVRGHSPMARVTAKYRDQRTLTLCENGYLEVDTMRCYRYPPEPRSINPHELESTIVAISHRLIQIQQIVAPVLILASLVALSWTLITFFYFQELKHTPGKIMFLLTCVMYMYYVVHLKLLLKHFSWGMSKNMQVLLRWCAICKYTMVVFLCYHLREFQHYYAKPRSVQLFHLVVQATGIVTIATVILIVGQSNHAFHLESLLGRLVFYQLPNTISAVISVAFLVSALRQARTMRQTMKQYEQICEFLITTYDQCLRFIAIVWITDSFYSIILEGKISVFFLYFTPRIVRNGMGNCRVTKKQVTNSEILL